MPGSSVTIERRWPMRRLNKVDLPMLGRPTIAMSGSEDGMKSLSFCTIAHQIVLDLRCLPVIYSTIIETDKTFENQVVGSVRRKFVDRRRILEVQNSGLSTISRRSRFRFFYLVGRQQGTGEK